MKTILIFIISLVFTGNSYSQWNWVQHIGGLGFVPNEYPRSLSTDSTNYYLIGEYGGNLYLSSDTLPQNGANQIFILKYSGSGNLIWSQSLGGNYNQLLRFERGMGVFDNFSNNLYLAGNVIGSVYFGNWNVGGSINTNDIFLAKMDLNGNYIWVKKGGGSGDDYASCFTNSNGKIYLISKTSASAQFDSFSLPAGGGLVQYDSSGNCLSAKALFNTATTNSNVVSLTFIDTEILFYGSFNTPIFQIDTFNVTNNGAYDGFIARADTNGNVKWLKQFGNSGNDFIVDLAIMNNEVYAIGGFQDSINLGTIYLNSAGNNILVAKFDTSGNAIWARNIPCSGTYCAGNKIIVDADGNTYITGNFSGTATFGNFQITTTNTYDMFLARYDSAGNCLGVKNFGQASGSCLATDNNGDVVVSGTFNNTVTIGSNSFTSYGGRDVFLAKSDAITGLEEPERIISNQLIIYANPNAGKCNITVPEEFVNESYLELIIFDNAGKTIQKKILEMNDGTIKVDIETQAKGVYSITLGNGKRVFSGKMVME